MRLYGMAVVVGCICFASTGAIADTTDDTATTFGLLKISGKLEFDVAEMLKARTSVGNTSNPGFGQTVDHIWYGHTIGTLNLESNPLENFSVRASFEFCQYMTMLPLLTKVTRDAYFGNTYWNGFYIREGQGIYSFVKNESVSLDMALGYMPYKYNDEVRDLGEFLFRSGTYPLFLLGSFDRPFARITGLRTSLGYGNDILKIKADVFGFIEREIRPINDLSVAVVAKANFLKMFELGGGVDFARLVPMDSRMVEPETNNNKYLVYNSDSTNIDTGYYSFRGTKIMAHATIDPFGMVRGSNSLIGDIIGENGGKLYGEYAIIGLKNYPSHPANNPVGYTKRTERSPWMVGVTSLTHPFITYGLYPELAVILFEQSNLYKFLFGNTFEPKISNHIVFGLIPAAVTFGGWALGKQLGWNQNWNKIIALDEISFELERFPSYSPDTYFRNVINYLPVPIDRTQMGEVYDSSTYVPRWNWSLYMKKQVVKHFGVVCQLARDHQRWERHPSQAVFNDFEAAMVKPDEWGWRVMGVFTF